MDYFAKCNRRAAKLWADSGTSTVIRRHQGFKEVFKPKNFFTLVACWCCRWFGSCHRSRRHCCICQALSDIRAGCRSRNGARRTGRSISRKIYLPLAKLEGKIFWRLTLIKIDQGYLRHTRCQIRISQATLRIAPTSSSSRARRASRAGAASCSGGSRQKSEIWRGSLRA